MFPALKSKAKSKSSSTAVKEQLKIPSKTSDAGVNAGNAPESVNNLQSGTFHTLETVPGVTSSSQSSGRYQHIDELENHSGSSPCTAAEFDSMSNNDSCSGESEDQKEKVLLPATSTSKSEAIPWCDTDKRDKIRQKNEKKHQRQKERRAQELHERCTGALMSRKLEFLTEKLVGMGFAVELATRALMLNEGRAEDSVSWLLEGGMGEEVESSKPESRANLKIDISDELAKIAELEIEFKCSKQDVERAVVSCEGDLEKAVQTLNAQQQEHTATLQKAVKSGETVTVNGMTKVLSMSLVSRVPGRSSISISIQQPKRDERDLNYPKMLTSAPSLPDPRGKTLQPSIKIHSKTELPKNVAAQSERLPGMGSGLPVTCSLASPLQVVTSAKTDAYHAMVGNEGKPNFQSGALKEPVVVMQRPQSVNLSQNLPSTSMVIPGLPPTTGGWNSNGIPSVDTLKVVEDAGSQSFQNVGSLSSCPPFYQTHRTQQFYSVHDAFGWGNSSNTWSNSRSSNGPSSLNAPSPLGLFTGWNSASAPRSSAVDWSTIGTSMPEFDYTSIDWSMDLSSSSLRGHQPFDSWSNVFMDARTLTPNLSASGLPLEMVDGAGFIPLDPSSYVGSREWTSPFAAKDIFRVPRQFVSPSSL